MATSDFQEVNVDNVDFAASPKTSGVQKAKLRIALIGETGSGKTSFINAIRGLEDGDDRATGTGVGEETIEAKSYPHPLDADVTLWDHPGQNTLIHSNAKSYFKTFYLSRFDAFLLFIKGNGTKTDLDLVKELDSNKKPFFLIRTNIDNDLPRRRNTNKENEILEKIRKNALKILANRENGDSEKKLFLISNHDPEKWEFGRLKKAILYELQQSGFKPMSASETTQDCTDEEIKQIDKKSLLKEVLKKMKDFSDDVRDKGVTAARKKMQQALENWKDEEIKLGLVGSSGVGKSSLINALRNVKDDRSSDSDAAKTGVVETTVDITEYRYPNNPKIMLCDLPGVGSTNYPDLKTYCDKINLRQFDAFVIVTTTRFFDCDVKLANKLRNMNKPFLFVRTKIDVDYDNEKEKKWFKEEVMLEKIKSECFKNLKSYDTVFLISNKHPSKWDFPRLVQAILNQLSLDKQVSFIFSMYIVSESILEEKFKKLRGRVYLITFLSVINKVRSDEKSRSYDHKVIKENVKFFKSQLGLHTKGSKEFEEMSANLQEEVQEFDKIDEMGVDDWMKLFAANDAASLPDDDVEIENLKKIFAKQKPVGNHSGLYITH